MYQKRKNIESSAFQKNSDNMTAIEDQDKTKADCSKINYPFQDVTVQLPKFLTIEQKNAPSKIDVGLLEKDCKNFDHQNISNSIDNMNRLMVSFMNKEIGKPSLNFEHDFRKDQNMVTLQMQKPLSNQQPQQKPDDYDSKPQSAGLFDSLKSSFKSYRIPRTDIKMTQNVDKNSGAQDVQKPKLNAS